MVTKWKVDFIAKEHSIKDTAIAKACEMRCTRDLEHSEVLLLERSSVRAGVFWKRVRESEI